MVEAWKEGFNMGNECFVLDYVWGEIWKVENKAGKNMSF